MAIFNLTLPRKIAAKADFFLQEKIRARWCCKEVYLHLFFRTDISGFLYPK